MTMTMTMTMTNTFNEHLQMTILEKLWNCWYLRTFESIRTLQTLHALTIKSDSGEHSQFLWCFFHLTVVTHWCFHLSNEMTHRCRIDAVEANTSRECQTSHHTLNIRQQRYLNVWQTDVINFIKESILSYMTSANKCFYLSKNPRALHALVRCRKWHHLGQLMQFCWWITKL